MNILITGATGYVGSHVLKMLIKKYPIKHNSYEVLVRPNQNVPLVKNIIFNSSRDKSVAQAAQNADVIIHCAAQIHGSRKEMFDANVEYTRTLVKNAKKNVLFIFMSTENVNHNLTDIYTVSKKNAEKIVSELKNHVILRPNVIYGPGEKKYVNRLINICRTLPIVPIVGDGKNSFQFIYIDDVCSIIICIVERNIKSVRFNKKYHGVYNISGPSPFTYNDLIFQIQKEFGTKKPLLRIPLWVMYPVALCCNNLSHPPLTTSQIKNIKISRNYDFKKQKNLFKYKETSLVEGLKKCIKH